MKYSNLLFSFIIISILSNKCISASFEEEIGPINVKYVTEDGIQGVYLVNKIRSSADLFQKLITESDSTSNLTLEVRYSHQGTHVSFERFKALFLAREPLAVYVLRKHISKKSD